MSEEVVLPREKIGPISHNPRNLIIFSKPKVGKTELAAGLPNALLLDLENGSDFISAMKMKASSIKEIKAIGETIKKEIDETEKYPYEYVVIDTVTALEDICVDYAEIIYSQSPEGSKWFAEGGGKEKYGNILNMPNGAGYKWHRDAYTKAVDYISTWAPNIIQLGHVKDIKLDKAGSEFSAADLDLTGKLKRIACSRSDSIGYLYRKGNKNIISFLTSEDVLAGARPAHLSGKEIILSEKNEDGSFTYHWDRIYLPKK